MKELKNRPNVKKVYDDSIVKKAFKNLRLHGFEARYNISVTESDDIMEGNVNYAVVPKTSNYDWKKYGQVHIYHNSDDLPASRKIAEVIAVSLASGGSGGRLYWNGTSRKAMVIYLPYKLYLDGCFIGDNTMEGE